MSLTEAVAVSLLRALVVTALAVVAGRGMQRAMARVRGHWARRAGWTIVLLPLIVPAMALGYAYSGLSLTLVHRPVAGEAFYAVLLALRLAPLVAILLALAPPASASPEALHCYALLREGSDEGSGGRGGWSRGRALLLAMAGPKRALAAAGAAAWLLAMGEFEIASLLGIRWSWTQWLFKAQVGGTPLNQTMRWALGPLALQLAVLGPVAWLLWRSASHGAGRGSAAARLPGAPTVIAAGLWAAAAVVVCCAGPAWIVLRQVPAGLAALGGRLTLWRELGCGLLLAGAAAVLVVGMTWRIMRPGGSRALAAGLLLACVPGLCGALLIGLALIGLFQTDALSRWYGSAWPLLIGLCLLMLPIGAMLAAVLQHASDSVERMLVRLVASARLARRGSGNHLAARVLWRATWRGPGYAVLVLLCVGFFDLTLATLLDPVSAGMSTLVHRLYNLMHYGQAAMLSALVVLACLVPVAAWALLKLVEGLYVRVVGRE